MEIELNQKSFNELVYSFNHKTTQITKRLEKIENNICWMKKIMSWQIALTSGIFVSILGVVIKFIFFS